LSDSWHFRQCAVKTDRLPFGYDVVDVFRVRRERLSVVVHTGQQCRKKRGEEDKLMDFSPTCCEKNVLQIKQFPEGKLLATEILNRWKS